MSAFRILFPAEDGSLSIVIPAPGITEEQALNAVPSGKPYFVVDVAAVPTDRTFRNAWEVDFTNAQVKA